MNAVQPVTNPPKSRLPALQNPQFLRYWIGVSLALTGGWMRITVQGYLVYEMTDDPFMLGMVSFLSALPQLLLAPFIGVVVDRYNRRTILALTQAFIVVNALVLATLEATGVLTVSQILVLAILFGIASAFDWPARLSLVPNMVTRDELQSAVALNSASFNGARIVGPAVGGGLIGIIGVAACFYLSAFAFLPSVIILMTIVIDRTAQPETKTSAMQNIIAGYRYIWGEKTLRSLLSVDLIPVVFGMSVFALLPALARDVYDQGSGGLGLLYSAHGVGALSGVMIVALMSGVRRRGRLVLTFVTLFALMLLVFAFTPVLWMGLLVVLTLGIFASLYSTFSDTLLQLVVEDEYRGRVMSVYSTFWGLTPIGYLQAGFIAARWSVQTAIFVNGLIVLVYVVILTLKAPEIRQLD